MTEPLADGAPTDPAATASTTARPHPALDRWQSADGRLVINGWDVERLAARVGATPFYAYDRAKISARVDHLRDLLPDAVRLHYAVKANPMPAVVHHLAGLVDGFDVASADEMQTALDTGFEPLNVGFAGPGKTDAELAQAAAAGIVVELESVGEMQRLARAAQMLGCRVPVAVRVNPDFKVRGSGMHMGGGASQFGVDAEAVPALFEAMADLPLDFRGFHIFAGSQNLSVDALIQAERAIADTALMLAEHAPAPVRHLNIGGGFGIPYFPKDRPLDTGPLKVALADIVGDLTARLPEAHVIVELGRYLVGEAGVYIARVIDKKVSRGQTYLVTDGGLHHQLAATGNFGQGIRRNYPLAIANRFDAPADAPAQVVGCLCTPIDLLGDKVALPEAQVGDLVAIFQSGAYGPSASPKDFLSHPHPREVLV
ncbi:pyridoxal-dependent decarboxylase, exosortase A system-associated [Rhodothalassium salexigens]|uniref:pyridoxal-dependent decarboxylase, exosortase A system-associated n=1 Tax=Rhodothalassium salexigens TaxID=1086 RepID=UPI001912ACFF|nr:pyridoxal-dependent decarboxylase, exosortase A system-associated [Rhodothalassium salexigens]MBK5920185.1 pyridoxal-dependent decarboxylase, exosortase A system-associated [Rhodothalassium salexigens]